MSEKKTKRPVVGKQLVWCLPDACTETGIVHILNAPQGARLTVHDLPGEWVRVLVEYPGARVWYYLAETGPDTPLEFYLDDRHDSEFILGRAGHLLLCFWSAPVVAILWFLSALVSPIVRYFRQRVTTPERESRNVELVGEHEVQRPDESEDIQFPSRDRDPRANN